MAPDELVRWAPRALGFMAEGEPGLVGTSTAGARE
jgi:hypothetical protein